MTYKWKLRRTENYYDVYVEDCKSPVNSRIERKLQMLVHNVQSELADITVPSYSYGRYNPTQENNIVTAVTSCKINNMELNMCTWSMNGLARWKMHHKDFIRGLETNDLVCVTET